MDGYGVLKGRKRETKSEFFSRHHFRRRGFNIRPPDVGLATGLLDSVSRLDVLHAIVPALRGAASESGHLSPSELERWAARDVAHGRAISAPAAGVARGISASGDLLVEESEGVTFHRSGSLIFAEASPLRSFISR